MLSETPKLIKAVGSLKSIDEDSRDGSVGSKKRYKRTDRTNVCFARGSSQQSDNGSMKSFYVKNVCSTANISKFQAEDSLEKQVRAVKKEREPTPCKSKKFLVKNKQSSSTDQSLIQNIEINLKISQLEDRLKSQKKHISSLTLQNQTLKHKIFELSHQLSSSQSSQKSVQFQNSKLKQQIKAMQSIILTTQSNLKQTKSNLQILKKSIKQNLIADLKKQNQVLKRNLGNLSEELEGVRKELRGKNTEIQKLRRQNEEMKEREKIEMSLKVESMRENYLQNQVIRLKNVIEEKVNPNQKEVYEQLREFEIENIKLQSEIRNLNIQLDYIKRKHMEEFKLFRKSKNEELTVQRRKYDELKSKFKANQKQLEELIGIKNGVSSSPNMKRLSQSSLLSDTRSRKFSFTLELSPD